MDNVENQVVFVYAETMLASLSARPSWGKANDKIKDAYVIEGETVKYFPYTHRADIDADLSDQDAIRAALGNSTPYWGDSRLKVLRIDKDDLVPECLVDKSDFIHCPKGQKYYNYTKNNPLGLEEAIANRGWSHEPNLKPRGLDGLA